MTFEQWYAKVDALCQEQTGLGIDDMADGPSWASWNDGVSPEDYLAERLAYEGWPA